MKTGKLNRNEFAIEMCKVGSELKAYNFDIFYDMKTIMKLDMEKRRFSNEPIIQTLHFFIRDTGTWLLSNEIDTPDVDAYAKEHKEYYTLEFCWNTDYIRNSNYVTVTKIK